MAHDDATNTAETTMNSFDLHGMRAIERKNEDDLILEVKDL